MAHRDELAPEIWARFEAKAALREAGLDDPHPETVDEYAGKLRTWLLLKGQDREAALAELRRVLGLEAD
jgi:hypothetical protein